MAINYLISKNKEIEKRDEGRKEGRKEQRKKGREEGKKDRVNTQKLAEGKSACCLIEAGA
jgi:predicted transposase YdaD